MIDFVVMSLIVLLLLCALLCVF